MTDVVSLPGFVSGMFAPGELTVMLFVIVPVPVTVVARTTRGVVAPAASGASIRSPAWSASVISILPKNAAVPTFVALIANSSLLPGTTGARTGLVLLALRSTRGSRMAAPPHVAVLLAGFGSVGPSAAIVAVLTGVPGATTATAMATEPSETMAPDPEPETRVQLTSCPLTMQVQPLPGNGVTEKIA